MSSTSFKRVTTMKRNPTTPRKSLETLTMHPAEEEAEVEATMKIETPIRKETITVKEEEVEAEEVITKRIILTRTETTTNVII